MGSFSAYRFMGFRAVAVLLLSCVFDTLLLLWTEHCSASAFVHLRLLAVLLLSFSERSKVSVLNPLFGPKSRFRSQISVPNPRSRTVRFVFRTVEVRRKEIKRKEAKRERRFQRFR